MAQQAGFEDLWISDHYHPWNDAQGHQIGPEQEAFFAAYREHVLPRCR